jgi:hypothetical protein
MPRGGPRTPSKPAAVSGPGALSQRTDGGAAQPVRPTPAAHYGDRAASVAQQQAAPMRAGGTATPSPMSPPAAGGLSPTPAPAPAARPDAFGPTLRPGEPLTAGVPAGPGASGPDPSSSVAAQLRAIYSQYPDDDLLDAILELERQGA